MVEKYQNHLALVGRLLLAYMFLPAGIGKFNAFAGTAGSIASKGLPMPELGALIAIVVEIGCGVALILGFRTRHAALVLALFTVAATYFFHNYWSVPAEMVKAQQGLFNKNVGVLGGLLLLAAYGAGAWSMDAKRKA